MRKLLLVAIVVALSSCVVPPPQGGYASGQGVPQQQPAAQGDCGSACNHYLGCKGMSDPQSQEACVAECTRIGYDGQTLAEYQTTDCPTAINLVEQQGGPGGQAGQGGRSPQPSQSSECQGCVRDGNECVWISQSNWGKGPYSGAVSSCAAHCCGL